MIPGAIETVGSTTITQMIPMKEKATIPATMKIEKEQEVLTKEDTEGEITAPDMNREEEDQEGTIAQMRETVGDTLAKTDEESAQGP